MTDMVNHPPHYTATKYEVADVADAWYPHEPHLWQANKYLARWDKKGDPIENLEKAIWYINRKISVIKEITNAEVKQSQAGVHGRVPEAAGERRKTRGSKPRTPTRNSSRKSPRR